MTRVGSWGYYMQSTGHQQEIELCGSQLSVQLDCPVHYPAYGKRLYECYCGVLFPAYVVQAAVESGDWGDVVKLHENGDKAERQMF